MDDRWNSCALQLENELPAQLFRTWIKPLVYLGFDESEHVLRLGAPNRVKLDWVRTQYADKIAQIAHELFEHPVRIVFEIISGVSDDSADGTPREQTAMLFEPTAPTGGRANGAHAGANGSGPHANGTAAARATDTGGGDVAVAAEPARAAAGAAAPGFSGLNAPSTLLSDRSKLNPDLTFGT